MKNSPLVSIVVVTYNSEKFVLETLESIKSQTYPRLELIITDDCSEDNTVNICEEWVKKNEGRFEKSRIVTSPVNTGIGRNANRGLYYVTGEWYKGIAGDDALIETCIEEYIKAINLHPEYRFFHSLCDRYKDVFSPGNKLPSFSNFPNKIFKTNCENEQSKQYVNFLLSSSILSCTCMINSEAIKNMNGFEERIRKSEDWPTWIKVSEQGYKFYFIDKALVKYRENSASVYSGSLKGHIFHDFYKTEKEIYNLYIKDRAKPSIRAYWNYYLWIRDMFTNLNMNKNTPFNRLLFRLLNKPATIWRHYLQIYG